MESLLFWLIDLQQSLGDQDEHESVARREMLARRPSYRKILNDLSGETGSDMMSDKIQEEESNDGDDNSQTIYSSANTVGMLLVDLSHQFPL